MIVIRGYPPGTVSKECIGYMMFFENFESEAMKGNGDLPVFQPQEPADQTCWLVKPNFRALGFPWSRNHGLNCEIGQKNFKKPRKYYRNDGYLTMFSGERGTFFSGKNIPGGDHAYVTPQTLIPPCQTIQAFQSGPLVKPAKSPKKLWNSLVASKYRTEQFLPFLTFWVCLGLMKYLIIGIGKLNLLPFLCVSG